MMRVRWLDLFGCSMVLLLVVLLDATAIALARMPQDSASVPAARDEALTPANDDLSSTSLQSKITALEANQAADDDVARALERLRSALAAVQQADSFAEMSSEFLRLGQSAPDRLRDAETELAKALPEPGADLGAGLTFDEVRRELTAAQGAVSAARQARQLVEQEAAARAQRREQIPLELTALRAERNDVEQRQVPPVPGVDELESVRAQRLQLRAELRRIEAQIAMLEEELRSYDARRDVLRVKRQIAERDVQQAEKRQHAWQTVMTAREQEEAARLAQQAAQAEAEAAGMHPLVAELAEVNRQFARQRTELGPKIERTTAELQSVENRLQHLKDDFRTVRSRVEQFNLTTTIGLLLRNKRASLPDIGIHERNLRERQTEISSVQLQRSELDDELLILVNLDEHASQLMSLREDIDPARHEEIRQAVVEQLRLRKSEFLPGLITALDGYLEDTLVRLDQSEAELVTITREYLSFVNERILWIRSANPVSGETLAGLGDAAGWALAQRHWQTAIVSLWNDLRMNWASVAPPLLFLLALAGLQPVIRVRIDRIAGEIRSVRTDTYGRTLLALLLTGLCVVVLPALIMLISRRLLFASDAMTGDSAVFGRAAAEALQRSARFLFVALSLWHVCRPRGLAEAHFRWRHSSLKLIRRNLMWLIPVVLPVAFIMNLLEAQPNESFKASLGRLMLVGLSASVAVFLGRLLKPGGGILQGYLGRKAGGWFERLRFVWYTMALGVPLTLAAISLAGYHYTSVQLGQVVFKTFALIIFATILHAMLIRWLLVAQRRLAMEQAKRRKAAQAEAEAAAAASAAGHAGSELSSSSAAARTESGGATAAELQIEAAEVDLSVIGEQTRRLVLLGVWCALLLGLWAAWADVLPALGALRNVELTRQVQTVSETVTAADGSATVRAIERIVPVTLANLLNAILVVVLTVLATRNIPGVLEIAVLQRLPLTASSRYAILTICRYVIMIVGIVLAFSMVGIGWSKVQWLAAAITVGLGFGLQEIFANFVSGIIILFEQPIRVGDTITINDNTGVVTRIRMRATTIRDWDRKEMIIPNKVFVTDRIVNWTLSDTVLRMRLPVGLAYGSDTEHARMLMLGVARRHPLVLRDPEPQAWFNGFGESTLDFDLRVFVANPDHQLTVRHELLSGIDEAFRNAGVEIAFPQRDLHIRSGLDTAVTRAPHGPSAANPSSQPDTNG